MRPIPIVLRQELSNDIYYSKCARKNDGFCEGRITWEHVFIYAGRQINEKWAILPLCEYHHLGKGLDKDKNRWLALNRTEFKDLSKYPKVDWVQLRKHLSCIYPKTRIFGSDHKENIKMALRKPDYRIKHSTQKNCLNCNNVFFAYTYQQKLCSEKCKYGYELKTRLSDPIARKAFTISGSISMGIGKREYFLALIKDNLGKNCKYCNSILSLDNMSIDHIEPFRSSKIRHGKEYLGLKKHFDRKENLQVICRPCNKLKSDMNHNEFIKLLEFLNANITIKEKIIKRLARSDIMWSFKRTN